jgi:hypothetical protein
MKKFSAGNAVKKLREDIFLKKEIRKDMKSIFLRTQKNILENSDFLIKPVLKQEFAKRQLETSLLSFTVRGLEIVKKAEEFEKHTTLANCKFELFRKINGSSIIFRGDFFRPLKFEKVIAFLYFPKGLPKKNNQKIYIYRNRYQFDGYKLIDRGSFRQKILNFKEFSIICKGEFFKKKIILKTIGDSNLEYWARIQEAK